MHDPREKEQFFDAWLALTQGTAPLGNSVQLPALTGSMLPVIPRGAILSIKPSTCKNCAVGQVVIYREDQVKLVAHRLLLRIGWGSWQWLFQKGDNNPTGRWIRSRDVVGLVTHIQLSADGSDPVSRAPTELASRREAWRSLMGHLGNKLLVGPRSARKWIKRIFLGPAHNMDGDQP